MTYTWSAVVAVLVAVVIDFGLVRTRLVTSAGFWTAYAIMLFFQLIVNGVLTGLPIVRYDKAAIIGWRVAYAPIEDVLFGFALTLVTLVLWVRLDALGRRREDP